MARDPRKDPQPTKKTEKETPSTKQSPQQPSDTGNLSAEQIAAREANVAAQAEADKAKSETNVQANEAGPGNPDNDPALDEKGFVPGVKPVEYELQGEIKEKLNLDQMMAHLATNPNVEKEYARLKAADLILDTDIAERHLRWAGYLV